jgi:hypothetical protein
MYVHVYIKGNGRKNIGRKNIVGPRSRYLKPNEKPVLQEKKVGKVTVRT